MPKLIRRTAVLAKIEVTSGVDPVPTGAANAILVRNVTITPIEQEVESRELVRAYLGNSDQIIVASWTKVEFEVELAGSGTAGTAPAYSPLLQGCGFAEADGASDVVYTPVGTGFKTLTFYINVDGVLHKMPYAAGNVAFSLDARKVPFMKFTFMGLFLPVIDDAAPTAVYSAFQKPVAVNKANTTLSLHGYAGVVESLQVDMKNEVPYRNLINFEGVTVNDRKPDGSISMEMVAVGTKAWLTSIAAGTTGALAFAHGTVAGNIVEIAAPMVQLFSPRFANSQGIQMLQANMVLLPGGSGNDEITITVK